MSPKGAPKKSKPLGSGRSARDLHRQEALSACSTGSLTIRHAEARSTTADLVGLLGLDTYAKYQSVSEVASRRGIEFELRLRRDGHEFLRDAIAESEIGVHLDALDVTEFGGSAKTRVERREAALAAIVEAIETGDTHLFGAVPIEHNPNTTYEIDYLLVHRATLTVIEVKHWPMIDGAPPSPGRAGAACDQAGIYGAVLRTELRPLLGTDPWFTPNLYLVNPRDSGYRPALTAFPARRRFEKGARYLAVTDAFLRLDGDEEIRNPLSVVARYVDRENSTDAARKLRDVLDERGHTFSPAACRSNCELSDFCHSEARRVVSVDLLRGTPADSVAPARTLPRVLELAEGAEPTYVESAIAPLLRDTHDFLGDLV